jgi:capsid portal protein
MAVNPAEESRAEAGVRFIVNAKGEKTEAVLPIRLYERLVELLEDAQDIHDAEEAMKNPDFIPWEEAEKLLDELPDSNPAQGA